MFLNRNIGAILIIAGTTIGAGMLALPMTSARFGFGVSVAIMISMWAFMACSAFMTLRLNQHYKKPCTIVFIAENALGKFGKSIGLISLCCLFYALLAAYITGGASLLHGAFETSLGISRTVWVLAFFAVFGGIVVAPLKSIDTINRALVLTMGLIFSVILFLLFPFVSVENLTYTSHSWDIIFLAIPVFFTSFGFHGSIPTIVEYLGIDHKNFKKIFLIGSFIPVIVYSLWQTSTLGILTADVAGAMNPDQDLGMFIGALGGASGHQNLSSFVNGFAFFAIATSFIGVGIGFMTFMMEQLQYYIKTSSRMMAGALVLCPPLIFALFYPQGFITALGFAAIMLSFLAVILPSLSLIKLFPHDNIRKKTLQYFVLCFGIFIIVIEILNKIG